MGGAELLDLCEKNNHIGFIIMQKIATMIGDRLTKQHEIFIKEVGVVNPPSASQIKSSYKPHLCLLIHINHTISSVRLFVQPHQVSLW